MKYCDVTTREGRKDFYRSSEWQILREFILSRNPLCERCIKRDRIEPATELHHRRDLADYPEGKLDPQNIEPLCKYHHNLHSALEASGSEKDLNLINKEWNLIIKPLNTKP
jgi:hypothetical protein